jgi:hypothetical protein
MSNNRKMPNSTKTKKEKPVFQQLKKIDGMEAGNWVMFTCIYAIFIGVMSGCARVYLPDLIYIFGVPMDVQQTIWVLGFALWGVLSILLKAHYEKK